MESRMPQARNRVAALNVFPPSLRFRVAADGELTRHPVEPIAADIRLEGDGKRKAFLKVVAGLIGVNFDSLHQRDKRRRIRRASALAMAVVVALIGMGLTLVKIQRIERSQSEITNRMAFLPDETDMLRNKIEAKKAGAAATYSFYVGHNLPSFWYYLTQKGESINTVAHKYSLTVEELQQAQDKTR